MIAEWRLSYGVAGASIMAFACSFPELTVNIICTIVSKDDLGLSVVLGSSILNIIFIPCICGYLLDKVCIKFILIEFVILSVVGIFVTTKYLLQNVVLAPL